MPVVPDRGHYSHSPPTLVDETSVGATLETHVSPTDAGFTVENNYYGSEGPREIGVT